MAEEIQETELGIRVEELEKQIRKIDRGISELKQLFPDDILTVLIADKCKISKRLARQYLWGLGDLVRELKTHIIKPKRKKK